MMEEKRISEIESLNLIRQMIEVAKEEHHEKGEGWLIWGWLLFLASITSAVLSYLKEYNYIGSVWTGMFIVGTLIGIATYLIKRGKKTAYAKTYVQELLDKLSIGFFVSLVAMIIASNMIRGSFAFGYFYILYAFWMFIYGNVLRFRPLIVGAVVNWIAAIAIFMIEEFMYDMIVSAVAILVGYLIPGYILRSQYKSKMKL